LDDVIGKGYEATTLRLEPKWSQRGSNNLASYFIGYQKNN